jgi:glycosyltransferase involved in cell wall biosynthesis
MEVTITCLNHEYGFFPLTRPSEEVRADSRVRITRVSRWATLAKFDFCPGIRRQLRRAAEGVDLLHLHTPNPAVLLSLAMAGIDVPIVITHHSDIIRQKLLNLPLKPFEHSVYKRAKVIFATNPIYKTESKILQRHADRVEVLPLGLDLDRFTNPSAGARQKAEEFRKAHGDLIWVFVGRLVYYKGLHIALQALKQVPGKLLIIGTGPLEASLRAMAAELQVADRVVWLGHASDDEVVGAYHAATAFWLPSNAKSEAFGQVQVEAMASGCPVINTRIPGSGVPWVSPDGETGLTVAPDDAAGFASAVKSLIDDPERRKRYATAARARALSEFESGTMAARSLVFYDRALGRNKS